METMQLASGYDRKVTPETKTFRLMTAEEGKALRTGMEVYFDHGGAWRRAKVNGAPRVWKRDAGRVEVPLKFRWLGEAGLI